MDELANYVNGAKPLDHQSHPGWDAQLTYRHIGVAQQELTKPSQCQVSRRYDIVGSICDIATSWPLTQARQ